MSWSIPTGSALVASGVNLSAVNITGFTWLYWLKVAAGNNPRASFADVSDWRMRLVDTGAGSQQAMMNSPAGGTIGFTNGHAAMPDATWFLVTHEWDEAAGTNGEFSSRTDNGTAGVATPGGAYNYILEAASSIALGRDFEGTYGTAHLLDHFTLVKRPLTSGERTALMAGDNPKDLLGSDVLVYLHDSKTAFGATFSDEGSGGAVTWVSGGGNDAPVDEPEGGGEEPSITLQQIERGRVLVRGLTRGLA